MSEFIEDIQQIGANKINAFLHLLDVDGSVLFKLLFKTKLYRKTL